MPFALSLDMELSLSEYIHNCAKKAGITHKLYFKRRAKVIDKLIKAGSVEVLGHSISIIEHITPVCNYRYAYFACPICAKKCRKLFYLKEVFSCRVCSKIYYTTTKHKISRLLFYRTRDKIQRKSLKNIHKRRIEKNRKLYYLLTRK